VWQSTGDTNYKESASTYIRNWATTYKPNLNPIDETNFDALAYAYMVLRDSFDDKSRYDVDQFFVRWATGYIQSIDSAAAQGHTTGIWSNNWQSHRVKLITVMAAAVDSAGLFDSARRIYWSQIDNNILADGRVVDFVQRDAIDYVVYDLEPLTAAALVARSRGEDWYHNTSKSGATLQSAITWLDPYASGKVSHDEFVHSTVPFDAQRARAGLPGFAGAYNPKGAAALYWMVGELDQKYETFARSLSKSPPPYFPPPIVVRCGR
jgi:hypothetical protein